MKLLVCDFDGTYFKDEESILINNQEVQKWRRENNLFMLSSGRSFQSLKKMCLKYNIEYDYLSCCDGSILYDKNDNIITYYSLNKDILGKFLSLKKYAKTERIQYSYPDDYYPSYQGDNLIGCNLVIQNQDITNKLIEKFLFLQKEYPNFDFLCYKHDEVAFFCLKNKGINKSTTVSYLKELLNLKEKDIYTVGDNENDYPMLKLFPSYYIGEVSEKIKKVCQKGYTQVYEIFNDINKKI